MRRHLDRWRPWRLWVIAVPVLCGVSACATTVGLPPINDDLPLSLRTTDLLDSVLHAHGQALYECRRDEAAAPGNHWRSEGLLATLVDTNEKSVGTLAPGGYFTAYDASYLRATPAAYLQVRANALPWVRWQAHFNAAERPPAGRFARTSTVQQVDTQGGLPPREACPIEGSTLLVPFAATFLIYRPAGGTLAVPPPFADNVASRPVYSARLPDSDDKLIAVPLIRTPRPLRHRVHHRTADAAVKEAAAAPVPPA